MAHRMTSPRRGLGKPEFCAKFRKFAPVLSTFAKDESGATAIEYSLMAAMMAVMAIGAATQLGDVVSEKLFALAEAMFPSGE